MDRWWCLHWHRSDRVRPCEALCVCGEEGVEVVGQGLRLVDRDQGVAVVDPRELGVREVVGESLGVGGGHELVLVPR